MIKGVWDAEYDSAKWFIHLPQLVINVKLNSQIEMAQMVAAAKWIILTTLTTLEQEKLNAFAKNLHSVKSHKLLLLLLLCKCFNSFNNCGIVGVYVVIRIAFEILHIVMSQMNCWWESPLC